MKLRISAIGASLTALGSSPHAAALDPESPRKKRPTISPLRQLEVSSDPCDENELDFKLDLKTDAKVEDFSTKRLSFDGGAKCTEVPSLRIVVNDDSLDDKYCLQPRNVWNDDFIIVAKPCNEGKLVQLWTVDFMGQWRNAHGDNMCITKEGGKVTLGTCSESYEEGYPTNFIYNKFSRELFSCSMTMRRR